MNISVNLTNPSNMKLWERHEILGQASDFHLRSVLSDTSCYESINWNVPRFHTKSTLLQYAHNLKILTSLHNRFHLQDDVVLGENLYNLQRRFLL